MAHMRAPVYEVSVETGFTAAHVPAACKGNAFRAGLETEAVVAVVPSLPDIYQILNGGTHF